MPQLLLDLLVNIVDVRSEREFRVEYYPEHLDLPLLETVKIAGNPLNIWKEFAVIRFLTGVVEVHNAILLRRESEASFLGPFHDWSYWADLPVVGPSDSIGSGKCFNRDKGWYNRYGEGSINQILN
jgi:hypothetical protein